ncbi:MAG: apolipoprotein N-acyltransferase, partial [Granulosicoccus sp.]|nr:apolipoprotein N-acyltransferase [Granulosicoccus sp.]
PFVASMDARGVDILSGGFQRDGDDVYNAVRQLGGDRALYRKRHLVPFGEYMPLRFILDSVANFIDIPMSDLSAGSGPHEPLYLQGVAIGVSICYEDVYGEEMRALLPAANLLVNVSNDAWFGDSAAPHQHEQKARMRAREFARPMIRVTNTGVSSVIDYRGDVLGRIGHDVQGILDVQVQPRTGYTLYARTGNWPVFILGIALCITAGLVNRKKPLA